jgi:hypothetical protein
MQFVKFEMLKLIIRKKTDMIINWMLQASAGGLNKLNQPVSPVSNVQA